VRQSAYIDKDDGRPLRVSLFSSGPRHPLPMVNSFLIVRHRPALSFVVHPATFASEGLVMSKPGKKNRDPLPKPHVRPATAGAKRWPAKRPKLAALDETSNVRAIVATKSLMILESFSSIPTTSPLEEQMVKVSVSGGDRGHRHVSAGFGFGTLMPRASHKSIS
jgi:hypothetical protein